MGIRDYRLYNMAIIDHVMTIIGVYLIHLLMWKYPLNMKNPEKRTWSQYFISLLLIYVTFIGLGVISHRIFNIQSGLSAYLGFNDIPIRK